MIPLAVWYPLPNVTGIAQGLGQINQAVTGNVMPGAAGFDLFWSFILLGVFAVMFLSFQRENFDPVQSVFVSSFISLLISILAYVLGWVNIIEPTIFLMVAVGSFIYAIATKPSYSI